MGIGVLTDVLRHIAKAEEIKCIPTVILTSLEETEEEIGSKQLP